MKKLLVSLLMVLALSAGIIVTAQADSPVHIFDEAELLTESQLEDLEEKACDIEDAYDYGVYILTVYDYSLNEYSVQDLAEHFYMENGLGVGSRQRGMLLVLSMAERDYWFLSYGDQKFFEDERQLMERAFLDNFGDNDWAGGFSDYLDEADFFIECVNEDRDYIKARTVGKRLFKGYGIGFGVSLVAAGIVCAVFYSQMNTAIRQTSAGAYVTDGGVHIQDRTDQYTHTTTTRTRIESNSSGSSSGGGSRSSGGFSGGGGKF